MNEIPPEYRGTGWEEVPSEILVDYDNMKATISKLRVALDKCASIAADGVFNTPKDAPTDKLFDEIYTTARSAWKEAGR